MAITVFDLNRPAATYDPADCRVEFDMPDGGAISIRLADDGKLVIMASAVPQSLVVEPQSPNVVRVSLAGKTGRKYTGSVTAAALDIAQEAVRRAFDEPGAPSGRPRRTASVVYHGGEYLVAEAGGDNPFRTRNRDDAAKELAVRWNAEREASNRAWSEKRRQP